MVAAWLPLLTKTSFKVMACAALVLAAGETVLMHDNTSLLHLPAGRDPMDRARGSSMMALEAVTRQVAAKADFLISNGYQNPSLLTFYIPGHPTTFSEPAKTINDQFSLWPGYRDLYPPGASAIFVSDIDHLPLIIRRDFRDTTRLDPITIRYRDRVVKSAYYFLCQGLLAAEEKK
jgi:hypothetical protein